MVSIAYYAPTYYGSKLGIKSMQLGGNGLLLKGWILVVVTYFVTFLVSANLGALLKPENHPSFLQNFVGGFMIIVPYLVSGIYARKAFDNPIKGVLWLSIVPVISERVLIFLIGTYYVDQRYLPGWNASTVIHFIQVKTPAFYFSIPYITLGLASILISVTIANFKKSEKRQ